MFLIVFELFPAVHPEAATTGPGPAGNWWGGQPPGPPPAHAEGAPGPGSSGYAPGPFLGGTMSSRAMFCFRFFL